MSLQGPPSGKVWLACCHIFILDYYSRSDSGMGFGVIVSTVLSVRYEFPWFLVSLGIVKEDVGAFTRCTQSRRKRTVVRGEGWVFLLSETMATTMRVHRRAALCKSLIRPINRRNTRIYIYTWACVYTVRTICFRPLLAAPGCRCAPDIRSRLVRCAYGEGRRSRTADYNAIEWGGWVLSWRFLERDGRRARVVFKWSAAGEVTVSAGRTLRSRAICTTPSSHPVAAVAWSNEQRRCAGVTQ